MKTKYLEVNQFSVRLSDEEREYINENFNELIKSGNIDLPYSKFFMECVSNAISTVKPKVAELSKPEDLQKIEALQRRNEALQEQVESFSIESNNLDVSNQGLMSRNKELLEETISLQKKLEGMKELSPDEIILKLEPKERHLLDTYSKIIGKTVKQMLIDEFFMIFLYRGPGDYNIGKGFKKEFLNKVDEHFKTKAV